MTVGFSWFLAKYIFLFLVSLYDDSAEEKEAMHDDDINDMTDFIVDDDERYEKRAPMRYVMPTTSFLNYMFSFMRCLKFALCLFD